MIRWLFATAIFLALATTSYWTGSKLAKRQVTRLQEKVAALSAQVADLGDRNARLEAQAVEAGENEAQWRKRYEAEVPTGRSKELLALIESQIAQGAEPDRIAFLVGTAANEQSCDGELQTKRFLVRTPLYTGANVSVSFADKAIVVTGEGALGSDAEGKPEAWFDPAQPVTLTFVEPGGASTQATGVLPLTHSVVHGDSEYRFTILASDSRGFITVTAERCAFP